MPPKPRDLDTKEATAKSPTKRPRNRKKRISQDKPPISGLQAKSPVDLAARLFSLISTHPDKASEIQYILHELNVVHGQKNIVGFPSRKLPQQELNAQPTASMSNGDEPPPLKSKEELQSGFFAAADAKALGCLLKALREDSGMTKSALARKMGVPHRSVAKLENGEHSPTVQSVSRWADALGFEAQVEFVPRLDKK